MCKGVDTVIANKVSDIHCDASFLSMATSFLGYTLPWSQGQGQSFWCPKQARGCQDFFGDLLWGWGWCMVHQEPLSPTCLIYFPATSLACPPLPVHLPCCSLFIHHSFTCPLLGCHSPLAHLPCCSLNLLNQQQRVAMAGCLPYLKPPVA